MYILYLTCYAALISLVMDILTNLYLSPLLHRKVQRYPPPPPATLLTPVSSQVRTLWELQQLREARSLLLQPGLTRKLTRGLLGLSLEILSIF